MAKLAERPAKDTLQSSRAKIYLVGDIHFKVRYAQEAEEFIGRCINSIKESLPLDAVVLLGDILDDHETAKVHAVNFAHTFFMGLKDAVPEVNIYVLMGNHDLINNQCYLSDQHFFNPYKKWDGLHIVDVPRVVMFGDIKTVMCPYVPPGKFVKALNTLGTDVWRDAKAIFAHQEFYFVKYAKLQTSEGVSKVGSKTNKKDRWNKTLPPVFSGHIHDFQQHPSGVCYVGSAMQVAFDESPDKANMVVLLKSDSKMIRAKRVPIGMRKKEEHELTVSEAKKFELPENVIVKLKIKDYQEKIKVFKSSPECKKFLKRGVRVTFEYLQENSVIDTPIKKESSSFESIFRDLALSKSKATQLAYEKFMQVVDTS